eukprot:276093_1
MGNVSGWIELKCPPAYQHRNAVAVNYNQFILISKDEAIIYRYDCLKDKVETLIKLDKSNAFKYYYISSFYHAKTNTFYICNYQKKKIPHTLYAIDLSNKKCQMFDGVFKCGEEHIIGCVVNDKYHMVYSTDDGNIDFWLDEPNSAANYCVLDLNAIKYHDNENNNGTFEEPKSEVRSVIFHGGHKFGMAYSEYKQSIYLFGDTYTFKGKPTSIIVYSEINTSNPTKLIVEKKPKISAKMSCNNVVSCNNGEYILFFNTKYYYKKQWSTIYILDLKQNKYIKSKIKCPFDKNESGYESITIDVLIMTYGIGVLTCGFIRIYSGKQFGEDIINLINIMSGREMVHLLATYNDKLMKHWRIDLKAILGNV